MWQIFEMQQFKSSGVVKQREEFPHTFFFFFSKIKLVTFYSWNKILRIFPRISKFMFPKIAKHNIGFILLKKIHVTVYIFNRRNQIVCYETSISKECSGSWTLRGSCNYLCEDRKICGKQVHKHTRIWSMHCVVAYLVMAALRIALRRKIDEYSIGFGSSVSLEVT